MLATLTVNVNYDGGLADDGNLLLREAIEYVNGTAPLPNDLAQIDLAEPLGTNDTIVFSTDPADGLDGGTILLTEGTALRITESVTIDASSLSGDLTIDASGNDNDVNLDNGGGTSVFYIDVQTGPTEPHIIEFAGLTITGGDTPGDGGGIEFVDLFYGTTGITTLTIRDSVITGNHTEGKGGGVYAHSYAFEGVAGNTLVNITGSTIEDNTADNAGGGVYADLDGNGIDSEGVALNLTDSSITGNEATHDEGGGVWFCAKFGGRFNATNSTISGNSATGANGQGGGLWISRFDSPSEPDTIANLDHVTITNNSSPDGGGLFSDALQGVFTTLNNTIVSGNDDGNGVANNIAGQIEAASDYNLIGQGQVVPANLTGAGNIFTDDPDLGPLMDNGGPTFTHAPDCTSPALDAGDPLAIAGQGNVPNLDQRGVGFTRTYDLPGISGSGGLIDIGAVELSLPDLMTLAADLDRDGDVDNDDLDLWQMALGVDAGGDIDGDGDTDGADFLEWQRQYAQTVSCQDWAANSIALLQLQTNQVFVSTTIDEDDGDYSLGDLSLREAVKIANTLGVPTTIVLPTGRYLLDITGNELGDATRNDLDITSDVTISGDGPGFTIIDSSGLAAGSNHYFNHAFHVDGLGTRLAISGVTLSGGDSVAMVGGAAVLVESQAVFELYDSAVVNNSAAGAGAAIRSIGGDVTIRRSVFTNNVSTQKNAALRAHSSGSVTIGQSIFALNQADNGTVTPNVWVNNDVAKINEGYNLYDDAAGNFFNQVPGTGDHLGITGYVVTTIEDTFDHTDDDEALSLREAVDLANTDTGASEIWLPAWDFVLTRDRGTNVTDTDVSYGDLDIKDSLNIRGVSSASGATTSVAWKSGIVDDIFDLLGDFTGDGITSNDDGDVDGGDYLAWLAQNGSTGGVFSADGDDDGDVDGDDLAIWSSYYGNTLDLFDVLV